MNEPAVAAASSVGALLSAWVLALTGLPYLSVFWSGTGALLAMLSKPAEGRWIAMATWWVATLLGAVIGMAAGKYLGQDAVVGYLLCAVGGFGAKPLMSSLLMKALSRVMPGEKP